MHYRVYTQEYGQERLILTGSARNKEEMREIILNHKNKALFTRIGYGKRSYTVSDIYAGR